MGGGGAPEGPLCRILWKHFLEAVEMAARGPFVSFVQGGGPIKMGILGTKNGPRFFFGSKENSAETESELISKFAPIFLLCYFFAPLPLSLLRNAGVTLAEDPEDPLRISPGVRA